MLWIYEAVFRKWVTPGLSDVIYFGRDALTLGLAALLVVVGCTRETGRRLQWVVGAALVMATVVAVQGLLSSLPWASLIVGAASYLTPLAALVLVSILEDREQQLRRIQFLVLSALPIQAGLTILQTGSPDGSVWNRVGDSGVGFVTSDAVVRATGTFISPSSLTTYAMLATALVVARLLRAENLFNPVTAVLVVSIVIVVALGGSRAAVLGAGYTSIGAVLWTLAGSGGGTIRVGRLLSAGLAVLAALWIIARRFPEVIGAFGQRFENAARSESASERILNGATEYWAVVVNVPVLGDGAGSHSLAGIAAGSPLGWEETELTRWVLELGLLGLLLCLVRQLAGLWLLVAAWRAARRSTDPSVWLVATALAPALLYLAVIVPSTQAGFAVTAFALLWLAWPVNALQSTKPRSRVK